MLEKEAPTSGEVTVRCGEHLGLGTCAAGAQVCVTEGTKVVEIVRKINMHLCALDQQAKPKDQQRNPLEDNKGNKKKWWQ